MGEKALDSNGKLVIVISKEYYRPLDVDNLCGDSNRAKEIIDWNPKFTLSDTIDEMILNHNNL